MRYLIFLQVFIGVLLFAPSMASAQTGQGIRSLFSFGVGTQTGFGDQLTMGIVGSGRFSGVAGLDLEYDFNRVTNTPAQTSRNIDDLHFVPNMKLSGIIYLNRMTRYATYGSGGIGVDIGTPWSRTNFHAGAGIEFMFLKDRVTLNIGVRFFFPRPVDVEKQKERILMDGNPVLPSYTDYYNLETYQIFLSLRAYY